MRNIFRTGRPTNTALTSKVKGQDRKVTLCVWQVLADTSRTKRPRNTKIGRRVAQTTGINEHQFQGQSSRSPGRLICWDRKCVISSERTVYELKTCHADRASAINCDGQIKACGVKFLHVSEGIPCRWRSHKMFLKRSENWTFLNAFLIVNE